MNTTHVGKIGRLPKSIRDMLGQRIENGEPGKEIVKWLNGLSGVKRVMEEQFNGRPITGQNLSEWKQNGHPEWLRQEQTRSLVGQLAEQAEDLGEASNGREISDLLASVLAAELTRLATALLEKETDPEKRWHRLREVHQELSQLRRDDHRAVRTMIKRERWNREMDQQHEAELERMKQEGKEKLRARFFSALQKPAIAKSFGGGEVGEMIAEVFHRMTSDLPLDGLDFSGSSKKPGQAGSAPGPDSGGSNPGESNLIQPNPTKNFNGQTPPAARTHEPA